MELITVKSLLSLRVVLNCKLLKHHLDVIACSTATVYLSFHEFLMRSISMTCFTVCLSVLPLLPILVCLCAHMRVCIERVKDRMRCKRICTRLCFCSCISVQINYISVFVSVCFKQWLFVCSFFFIQKERYSMCQCEPVRGCVSLTDPELRLWTGQALHSQATLRRESASDYRVFAVNTRAVLRASAVITGRLTDMKA